MPNLPKKEGEPYKYVAFPAFCTSPKGERVIIENEGDVPAGWTTPDGKVKPGKSDVLKSVKAPEAPKAVLENAPTDVPAGEIEVDAAGTPWNEELHSATKTQTKAGLWRMKVGVSRPDAAPALDL